MKIFWIWKNNQLRFFEYEKIISSAILMDKLKKIGYLQSHPLETKMFVFDEIDNLNFADKEVISNMIKVLYFFFV